MFIRKAARYHLGIAISEMGSIFNSRETARLKHITMLQILAPGRTPYSLTKKVAKNLGISEELAALWIKKFEEVGPVDFDGLEDFKRLHAK